MNSKNNTTLTNNVAFVLYLFFFAANCFCKPPTIQFKTDECGIYGQCVYLEESPAASESAKVGCGLVGMTLVDVYSDEKDKFLTGLY